MVRKNDGSQVKAKRRHSDSGTTSQNRRHMKEDTYRETLGEPDNTTQNGETTSHSGKQMKPFK